ncbi:glycosyltransferase [Winogradskyella sp. A3E31]|uniref:glycosyltransferase n=1 Tax=Winogradskyella sp. A3E31 TaxID=3349637 RepID=UPI00398B141C
MDSLKYSFIIPVFNRPQEIRELLESFENLEGDFDFEIVIIEDGSTQSSEEIIKRFVDHLNISYYYKDNSGPGDSRNYGMQRANGNYFIILDSDVILPKQYLVEVDTSLKEEFYHCFGGPDAADKSFTNLQKAINFTMTSFLTTGGIRGGSESVKNFQPRSFNMGLSKEAFIKTNGFGKIHPGEDPDLSLRLNALGYKTKLIKNAYVYHKRRISWSSFYKQVNKFGMARPILNRWHPRSKSPVFWLPTIFSLGFILALVLLLFKIQWFFWLYVSYFVLVTITSAVQNNSITIGIQSAFAIAIQFFGYGLGFLISSMRLMISSKPAEELFPKLFFK